MIPTHFAGHFRASAKRPAESVHGPIRDDLLLPLAAAGSRASGWSGGEMSGHRARSASTELIRIRASLVAGLEPKSPAFVATPLTEAEHDALFPDEPETPMSGGYPAAMFPTPATTTGA